MPFTITITDNSINVIDQRIRRLVDQDTGETIEIPDPHGSAIGLGDYTNPDDFAAAVAAKIVGVCGKDLAAVIADKATATALIADAQAQAAQIVADARATAAAPVDAIAEPPTRA